MVNSGLAAGDALVTTPLGQVVSGTPVRIAPSGLQERGYRADEGRAMIAWFARNDVAANLLMATVLLLGGYSLLNETAVEIFPEFEPNAIMVRVSLRGASPEDAELGIATRVEQALEGLDGIKRVVSRSSEGGASIIIEITDNQDAREALDEIKTRVDAIDTFPEDSRNPVIRLAQRTHDVITVVVSGPYSEEEIRLFAERVRDDLLRMDGISQVSLDAVRRYEIAIEASQDRLRRFDLTLAEIAAAVRASSADLSAGNVRTQGGDVLIRSKGQAYRRSDFESIVVKTNPDGTIVRVADVARVDDGFQEDALKTTFDGDFAALIQVQRVGDEKRPAGFRESAGLPCRTSGVAAPPACRRPGGTTTRNG